MAPAPAKKSDFRLEELEPRVMLSASLPGLAAAGSALASGQHHLTRLEVDGAGVHSSDSAISYQASAPSADMFADIATVAPVAHPTPAETLTNAANATANREHADHEHEQAAVQSNHEQSAVSSSNPEDRIATKASASSAATTQRGATITQQLTNTLRVANGPPTGSVTKSSFTHSNANGYTLNSLNPEAEDLVTFVDDVMAGLPPGMKDNETFSLATVVVGDFLELSGVTLKFTGVGLNASGNGIGTVQINDTSATLFAGGSFTGTFSGSVNGIYDLAASKVNLTASGLTLTISGALQLTASSFMFAYDPTAALNQQVASVTASVNTTTEWTGFSTGSTTLNLRNDGFSFGNVTLSASLAAYAGNLMESAGATLSAQNFNVSFGATPGDLSPANATTLNPSFTGTITLDLPSLQFYPTGQFFQTLTSGDATGNYDFTGFVAGGGTAAVGQLTVVVPNPQLVFGEALQLSVTGNVTLTPESLDMGVIGTATASSPEFAGIGTATLSDIQLTQTGFTLGSFKLTGGASSIGSVITFSTVEVDFNNFGLTYIQKQDAPVSPSTTPSAPVTVATLDGEVGVDASNAVLFPGFAFLDGSLGDLVGTYDLSHGAPVLYLDVSDLEIGIGDAITINLGDDSGLGVYLNPGQPTMLTSTDATVTANVFTGMQSYDLPNLQITQTGLSLGSFTLQPASSTPVAIGNFLSFTSVSIAVNNFSLTTSPAPAVGGSITVTVSGAQLYPGDPNANVTYSSVNASYDFSSPAALGTLTLTVVDFSLTLDNELDIAAPSVVLTPNEPILATINSAEFELPELANLQASLPSLTLTEEGFAISSMSNLQANSVDVGDSLDLVNPTLALTKVDYEYNGTASALSGTVGVGAVNSTLELGASATTSPSPQLSGGYDLSANNLGVDMGTFNVTLPGLATITAANALISYNPTSNIFQVGITGVNFLVGTGSGANAVGLQISDATVAVAVFGGSSPTYALDAAGGVGLVGLSNTLTITSSSIEVRYNNTGHAVNQTVNVDSDPDDAVTLAFTGNETSVTGRNMVLNIGDFAIITGDLGFNLVTNGGTVVAVGIAAQNVTATVGVGDVGLDFTGIAVSLLIVPGASGGSTTFALQTSGGTVQVDGIPDLTIEAGSLGIIVNTTGADPTTLTGATAAVLTPEGPVTLDLSAVGPNNVEGVMGSITNLSISNFVSIQGQFTFAEFTGPSGHGLVIAADNINAVLGSPDVNVTISGGSLGLVIVPGSPPSYALITNSGTASLNGVQGLTLNGSLIVKVNTGVDAATLAAADETVNTPGGLVTLNFAGLTTNSIKDIEGTVNLTIQNFLTLSASFGFQSFLDPTTGLTDIVVGATNVNTQLGTNSTNIQITGASFGLVIVPNISGGSAYALLTSAGSVSLNGMPGLTLMASNLAVEVNSGITPDMLENLPATVQTPDGNVPLDFTSVMDGNITAIAGSLNLAIADSVGSQFISVSGDFGFQMSGGYIVAGADNVNITLGTASTNITLTDGSLAMLIVPGNGGSATYAFVATADNIALNGISGITLQASNLLVKFNNTGMDPTGLPILSQDVPTPDNEVNLGDLLDGLGAANIASAEGTLTMGFKGYLTVKGDFGFQVFTDPNSGNSDILIAAQNVVATMGANETYVTIQGASLALLILPGTSTTYALSTNGGTDSLTGVEGLTLTGNSLIVKGNNTGQDPATVVAGQTVQTPDGPVSAGTLFTGVGSANVTDIEGTATLAAMNQFSITGSFAFNATADSNGNITKILVGVTNVTAFVGTSDQSLGVEITNTQLGLALYLNDTTTFALYAMAQITPVGLTPDGIGLTGTVSLSINTTGEAVNESITTPGGVVNIAFTDGTNNSPDQTNIVSFGGSLTLTISAVPLTLTGAFSFSTVPDPNNSGGTLLLIGVTGVAGANITPTGGSSPSSFASGMMGIVVSSSGYALTASGTVSGSSGGSSASATLTIRRNTTPNSVSQTIVVGATRIPVVFSSSEVQTGGTAFQNIALNNSSINLDNTLIISAGTITSTTDSGGTSIQSVSNATIVLQDPTRNPPTPIITFNAQSATYATVQSGGNYDNMTWVNGGTDIQLQNLSFSLGTYVSFTANAVTIKHYTDASNNNITTFTFTNATITLTVNSQQLVSVTGNLSFKYGSATGFALDTTQSNAITSFSFFGSTAGSGSGGGGGGGSGSSSTLLGPISVPVPSTPPATPIVSLSNLSLNLQGLLSVTIAINIPSASITTSLASATLTNLTGTFNLGMTISFANPTAAPTNITASSFTLTVGSLTITVGSYLTLTATNVGINPNPGEGQYLVSFGNGTPNSTSGLSATLTVGAFSITGSATNFAIAGDGSLVALSNFSVTFSLGQNQASSISWPTWLPFQSATIVLTWPGNNFNAAPANFLIDLSVVIDTSGFQGVPITLTGNIQNLVIDTSKLAAGQFPIVSIGSFNVNVTGSLFGLTIQGTLIVGIVNFDQSGAVVDSHGIIQSLDSEGNLKPTGQMGVGPFTSALYGGIQATFSVAGAGFTIRIGVSQYGPLSIYVSLTTPTGVILDPTSGLAMNNFRGGISLGGFPAVTLSNPPVGTDALQLNQSAFTAPADLTPQQWQNQMVSQVALQYHNQSGGSGVEMLNNTGVTFQAGVTLYDAYASQSAFKIDGDIFLDTSGKMLVIGTATFANSFNVQVKMFADLSQVSSGQFQMLFLMNIPAATMGSTPPIQIYGVLNFMFTTANGQAASATNPATAVQFALAGGANFTVLGNYSATLLGSVALTFGVSIGANGISGVYMRMDVNAVLTITYLGKVGMVSGSLTLQLNVGGGADLWGALLLSAQLPALPMPGITIGGNVTAFFQINTSSNAKTVTLTSAGGPSVMTTLQPGLFAMYIQGVVNFSVQGAQTFTMSGTLAMQINAPTQNTPASVTIFANAMLSITAGAGGPNLLTFQATGLLYADNTGFAAMLTLSFTSGGLPGLSFAANFLLVVNTTGKTISYAIPSPPPALPGAPASTPPIPTVLGPNFASNDPLALTSYEQPGRMLVIQAGPPPAGTTNYTTWTPAGNAPYLIILARGSLTIENSLTLTGSLNILAGMDGNGNVTFSLQANAMLNLIISQKTVFSFSISATLQINSAGVSAVLALGFSNPPTSVGFKFGANASFLLLVNTTNAAVTLNYGQNQMVTIMANTTSVLVSGAMNLPGISITGTFGLVVNSNTNTITVSINATAVIYGVTFNVVGSAGIYDDANPGIAFSIMLTIGANPANPQATVSLVAGLITLSGSFLMQINTSALARNGINPGLFISVTISNFYLLGFTLTGQLNITITPTGFNISVPDSNPLMLDFFGYVNIKVSGYINSNGTFAFNAGARISMSAGPLGVVGTLTASFSNANGGSFNILVAGSVTSPIGTVDASAEVALNKVTRQLTLTFSVSITIVPAIDAYVPFYFAPYSTIFGDFAPIHINTPAVVLAGTVSFALGQLAAPPPPVPDFATAAGGTLTLALGANGVQSFVVTNNGGVITVTAPSLGQSLTFNGVTQITDAVDPNGDPNADYTIKIANNVTQNVTLTLGAGNNTLADSGTGNAIVIINGGTRQNGQSPPGTTLTLGGNATSVIVNGDGNNVITISGSATNLAINGNGNNTVSVGTTTTIVINGGGNNSIITGTGMAMITNAGAGSNSITIGSGGGNYIENLVANGVLGRKTTFEGNVAALTVIVSGYNSYNLTNTDLVYGGSYDLAIAGIGSITLQAPAAATTISMLGWTGSATIIGGGATTLLVGPGNTADPVSYAFTTNAFDTFLNTTVGDGNTVTTTVSNVQKVSLIGGNGTNTYDVSGWTGQGALSGPTGSVNTVIATGNNNYTLTDGLLTRTSVVPGITYGNIMLQNILIAQLTGGAGADVFNVGDPANPANAWTGLAMLTGVSGENTYNITLAGGGTLGPVPNAASGGRVYVSDAAPNSQDVLNVNAYRTVTLTPPALNGQPIPIFVKVLAQRVYYNGIADLNINGLANGLRYNIQGTTTSVNTTINTTGMPGAAITGANINIGAKPAGGVIMLDYLLGSLDILAGPGDTINVSDIGSLATVTKTGTLDATTLVGLGMGGTVTYAGLIFWQGAFYTSNPGRLNFSFGPGTYTLNILAINAGTATNVSAGTGTDTINIGSDELGTGGTLDGIQSQVSVGQLSPGQGTLIVNVDDSGDLTGRSGKLTSQNLTGLGMASGIFYSGVTALNIALGDGGNTFMIDTYNLLLLLSYNTLLTVDGGTGDDVFNVRSTMSETTINTGATGESTINVGSLSPAPGGIVDYILGILNVNGNGNDTMNVDDTGSLYGVSGNLTYNQITGLRAANIIPITYQIQFSTDLVNWTNYAQVVTTNPVVIWTDPSSMGAYGFYRVYEMLPGGGMTEIQPLIRAVGFHAQLEWLNNEDYLPGIAINYTGLSGLNISLGNVGNAFNIFSTAANTVTTLNTGDGANLVNVQTTTGETKIVTGAGANFIYVGSEAPDTEGITDGIQGALDITGDSSDNLHVDDSGSDAVRTGTLSPTSLTGLGMGPDGITFSSGVVVQISPGSGDTIINAPAANTSSSIHSGSNPIAPPSATSSSAASVAQPAMFHHYYFALYNRNHTGIFSDASEISASSFGLTPFAAIDVDHEDGDVLFSN